MQSKKQKPSLKVKNYYLLSLEEIDDSISKMKVWLSTFPSHEKYWQVRFALNVAMCAKNIKESSTDELTEWVIDKLS